MIASAPYFDDVTPGASTARADWINAEDGVRLRAGLWLTEKTAQGTVFLFPGRTEYIEKYCDTADDLARHGLASVSIDWRGQGLSDRVTKDPMVGHVNRFSDFQKDVAALFEWADALDVPKPWYLLGHSMGGCIGLRALVKGAPVKATAFSGPMWGIQIGALDRPFAWLISGVLSAIGRGHRYAPRSLSEAYVLSEPFETNGLTRDKDAYQLMRDQVTAHPELSLGGPSMRWLNEALRETRALHQLPSPDMPCFTFVGSDEAIVDKARITSRMDRWTQGNLHVEPGGRHELLMEDQSTRRRFTDMVAGFFLQT